VPRPPQNRTCGFHRIRLKQACEDPVRSRRTWSSAACQSIACQSRFSPSGPFTITSPGAFAGSGGVPASNLSEGADVLVTLSSQAHLTPVSTLSGRARARIRPVIRRRAGGGRRLAARGFLSPFGHRHSLLGHPLPAAELALPHGRVTGHVLHAAGPQRGCHVPHIRDATGVGAPYTPATAVFLRSESHLPTAACRLPTARLLPPHWNIPSARFPVTRHQTGVHTIRPSGLPLACRPRDGTGTLGLES
jgi:hypothetical protein